MLVANVYKGCVMKKIICTLLLFLISNINFAAEVPYGTYPVNYVNKLKCIEFYNNNGNLYCSFNAGTITPIDHAILNYEKFNIAFDDRFWAVASGQNQDFYLSTEYIPKDDIPDMWSEMITSQYIPGPQATISPRQYFNRVMEQIIHAGFQPIITITKETPDELIAEFRVKTPTVNQDELQRIIKTENGFYALHYAKRSPDIGPAERKKWLNNLQKSTLKNADES